MWLKRRPKNSLGAPANSNSKLPLGLKITFVILFILLPLAGMSFLLVAVILFFKNRIQRNLGNKS